MKSFKAFENFDFLHSEEARTIRLLSEYLEPAKRFENLGIDHTIIFFGSSRLTVASKEKKYYQAALGFATDLAKLIEEIKKDKGENIFICTGGGPGIMEAVNKGASKANSSSLGLNIELPFEQKPNKYITSGYNFEFHYFFMRKYWFFERALAVVIFPGGFGTLDEFFEALTLLQTNKLKRSSIPILLYDQAFWEDLINFNKLVDYNLILPEDLELFNFFDTPAEGLHLLKPKIIDLLKKA